jgi:glutamate-1-semialdehyde 2,1-aminomutase
MSTPWETVDIALAPCDDPPVSLLDEYRFRTPGSSALFERAARSIPGGSTRTTVFNPPYPPYMVRGDGLRTWDVDGNEYRDFLGNYTSLILGHAHPAVVEAVERQVRRGSAFAAPTEVEIELAEEIRRRLPSVDRLRFTNSGTEATMFAIRAARAHTGRPLVAVFDRFYHGTHDTAVPGTPGVPDAVSELVVRLPWGDPEGVESALHGRDGDIAAIIIEPVQGAGGVRPAEPAFLRFLRDLCDRIGAVLIFDEIIAFRIGPNGAQGELGVRPDLTTLGKIVGGGYPLAAFGGSEAIMGRFDARRPDALIHGGTFNGNPVAAAAGLATLRELTPDVYSRLAGLGDRLRDGLAAAIEARALDARVTGIASLFQVIAGPGLVGDGELTASQSLFLGLLLDGFHVAPRGMGAMSTPMTDADVDAFVEAAASRLAALRTAEVAGAIGG